MKRAYLLGIDPGREKFGWAFGSVEKGLLCSGIGEAVSFHLWVAEVLKEKNFAPLRKTLREGAPENLVFPGDFRIVLGSGTGSPFFGNILKEALCPFCWGEEAYSTMEARKLYWDLHPPQGIRRLLPRSLLVPPRPVDDLAAWHILRKALCF